MKNLVRASAMALVFFAAPCDAQTVANSVVAPANYAPIQSTCVVQPNGTCIPVSTTNPLPVTGGGGGDASSANQTAVQATPGSDATKATAIQGVTGGKAVAVAGNVGTILQDASGRVMVGGVVADGIAPTGNSIHIGGVDAGGLKRTIKTDTSGQILVGYGAGTFPTSVADGANIGVGSLGDSAWTSGSGSTIALLKAIDRDTLLPLSSGSNLIGKVGIDQTTPGSTNGVVANGGVAAGASDSGNPVKIGGLVSTTLPTALTTGLRANLWAGPSGQTVIGSGVRFSSSDGVGNGLTAAINSSDNNPTYLPVWPWTWNGTTWDRVKKGNVTARMASAAASVNNTLVKNAAGDVHTITAYNATASVKFLTIYNKATAPVAGTDTPVLTYALPPNATFLVQFPNGGQYFSVGIGFAVTGAGADADTTALAAGDVVGLNLTYS